MIRYPLEKKKILMKMSLETDEKVAWPKNKSHTFLLEDEDERSSHEKYERSGQVIAREKCARIFFVWSEANFRKH